MGADMLVYAISVSKHDIASENGLKLMKQELEKVKKNLNEKPFLLDEWEESADYNDTEDEQELKDIAKNAVDKLILACAYEHHREMTWLNYPERFIIVTGGLSWGDMPTELSETVYQFQIIPATYLEGTLIQV